MSAAEAVERDYDWRRQARPAQRLPSGAWRTWLVMAGRGWGKSRCGAEAVRELVRQGAVRRVAFIGLAPFDLEMMVDGPSGILRVTPPAERPKWLRNRRRLEWPSGAWAQLFTATPADLLRMRGLELDLVWGDEPGAWPKEGVPGMEAVEAAQAASILTTTPAERFCTHCHALRLTWGLQRALARPGLVLTRGSSLENRANLAKSFTEQIQHLYNNTDAGRVQLRARPVPDSRACTCKEVR